MTTEDKIDILTAENAIMRQALEHEVAIAEKQINLLKSRGDDLTPTERNFGSAIWRAQGRMQGVLDSIGAPTP